MRPHVDELNRSQIYPAARVELWDTPTLAQMLNVSKKALDTMRTRGEGPPFVRIGRLVRYDPQAIATYLAQQTRQSTSEGTGLTRTV